MGVLEVAAAWLCGFMACSLALTLVLVLLEFTLKSEIFIPNVLLLTSKDLVQVCYRGTEASLDRVFPSFPAP